MRVALTVDSSRQLPNQICLVQMVLRSRCSTEPARPKGLNGEWIDGPAAHLERPIGVFAKPVVDHRAAIYGLPSDAFFSSSSDFGLTFVLLTIACLSRPASH